MNKRIRRRSIASLLAAVLVFTAVPVSANAAETVDVAEVVGTAEVVDDATDESQTEAAEEQTPKSEEGSESETERTEDRTETEAVGEDETGSSKDSEEMTETDDGADSMVTEEGTEESVEEAESENEAEIEEEITDDGISLYAASDFTQDDAVAWVKAQSGKGLDYDGKYGVQCVDLICYYYKHLVGYNVVGNATNYTTNALPAGWTRISYYSGFVAQPGDIAVWKGVGSGDYQYGHIGIVMSADTNGFVSAEQNYRGGNEVCKVDLWRANYAMSPYGNIACVIRPNFKSSNPIGDDLPNGGSQTIMNGDYHIITGVDNNMCLTIGGPTYNNGENAQLWHSTEMSNQIFTITWLGTDKGYKIIHKFSGKSLDVAGASKERGANVWQWDYYDPETHTQQWVINEVDNGAYYTIQSRGSGWYLDVENAISADGTNVRMWEGNGSNAQKWRFIPAGGQTIPDGDYQIITGADSNKCLSIDGTNVQVNSKIGQSKAVYTVTYLENGFYKIVHKETNMSLDVVWGKTEIGTGVQIIGYDGNVAQQWAILASGNGYYTIRSRCSGHCLDVAVETLEGQVPESTKVHMWSGHGRSNQQWKFIPYIHSKLPTPTSTLSNATEVEAGTQFYLDKNDADTLYYTWDGTTPTRQSTKYSDSEGLTIPTGQTTCTLKVIGVKEGYQDSDILEITYNVKQKTPSGEAGGGTEGGNSGEEGGNSGEGDDTPNPEDDDPQDGVKWHYSEQNVAYKDLSQYGQIVTTIKPKTYDGTPYKPVVKVTTIENGKTVTLTEGPDYRVLYYNNIHAGTASVTVKGNGVYKGTLSRNFEIKKKSCKKLKVVTNSMLTGDSQTPKIYVYNGNILLKENKDYTLSGITPDLTATKGTKQIYVMAAPDSDYEGMISAKITVYDADKGRIKGIIDSPEDVKLSQSTYQYTGKACKPTTIVTVDGNTLIPGKDYTIKYKNNKDAGTASATITGKGSYVGSIVKEFTIEASNGEFTLKKPIANVTYNGKLQKPKITVMVEGKTLKLNKDYTLSYSNNLHATERAKVTVRGKGNYVDAPTKVFYFTINPCHIKKASVKGGQGSLLITHARHTLIEGVDYDVIYGVAAGKGKISVTIKAKEGSSFTGEVSKKVKQVP